MAKIIEAHILERCRQIKALRVKIKNRQEQSHGRLEELQGKFPAILAGVTLQAIDKSEAEQVKAEIRLILNEVAAMEIALKGLGAWSRGSTQHHLAAQAATTRGE